MTEPGCAPLGEVAELAEGARLEIVYTASNRIEGSNPSLSAKMARPNRDGPFNARGWIAVGVNRIPADPVLRLLKFGPRSIGRS